MYNKYNKYINAYLSIIYQTRQKTYYDILVQAKNKNNQLIYTPKEAEKLSQILFKYNNPKKVKMALWFLTQKQKPTIRLPQDQYKVDQAYQIVQKKRLNFQKYNSPEKIINSNQDLSAKRLTAKLNYNSDNEPMFSNKKVLKNGVVVYNVEDSKQGQLAVRRAIDYNWGYEANPWCLAARPKNYIKNNIEKIQQASQQQKYQLLYGDKILASAWDLWSETYIGYPKRIAFQNNQLLAFCANNQKVITWWNRNDDNTTNIPGLKNEDDSEWNNFQYNGITFAKDPNISLEILYKLVTDNNWQNRYQAIQNPNISKIFMKLLNSGNDAVMQEVASKANLPIEYYNILVNNKNKFIREHLLYNMNVPNEILIKLVNDDYPRIRWQIAGSINMPKEVLVKLSSDNQPNIRQQIAGNINTPKETLIKLSTDENYQVRRSLAANENAPKEALINLFNDENKQTRQNVAWNRNTPKEILIKLANDNQLSVKQQAIKTINILNNLNKNRFN